MNPSANPDWTVDLLTRYQLAFGFLAQVFYESPRAEFVTRLGCEDYFSDWPLKAGGEDTCTGVELMRAYCAGWQEGRLADLEADFNRLFTGPGPPMAPPWESYYLSRDHLLFQEQTLAVREAYGRFGLDAPRLHREPDDSMGLELGFLAELCAAGLVALREKAGEALEEVVRGQREFLRDHLLRWAPECLRLVIAHARQDYYRGGAYLALGCLAEAAEDFGVGRP